ncbi:MAG: hypothetical protein SGJ00_08485 [bacterium]|nr:hypothetical protein [bacterium]
MKNASKADKERVVKIICESFNTNPHVDFIVKNDAKRPQRMAALAAYAFEVGMRKNGVYLTDDGLGVAIIFKYDKFKLSLYEYWLQLGLVFKVFTPARAIMVDKLESLIKRNRASNISFLYLWFFGVADESLGSTNGRDLMKFIFKLSQEAKLPIYLETSLRRNMIIYKRFGFEEYNILNTKKKDLTMWYMKRPFNHQL